MWACCEAASLSLKKLRASDCAASPLDQCDDWRWWFIQQQVKTVAPQLRRNYGNNVAEVLTECVKINIRSLQPCGSLDVIHQACLGKSVYFFDAARLQHLLNIPVNAHFSKLCFSAWFDELQICEQTLNKTNMSGNNSDSKSNSMFPSCYSNKK